MPPLQIDFEDGFSDDTVVVSAAGQELWRQEDVTTGPANLAAVARVEIPDDMEVEVHVPTQGLSAASHVVTPYLEVRIENKRLTLLPTRDLPFHL
jgi:hypothetical protein